MLIIFAFATSYMCYLDTDGASYLAPYTPIEFD